MPETQGRMTLWGVEVFLAVAEEGSISSAARRLGVSPPAVSQQLAATETALGATLFDRSARPFSLTVAGRVFRRHAQSILNTEAEARADLARADLSRSTILRLGVIEDFDAEVTPDLLTGLAAEMAEARFRLETGPSHRLLDQLESRALDLVVTAEMEAPFGDHDWREVHRLMTDPFVIVRPKGQSPEGLILYSSQHLMGRQITSCLAHISPRPPVRFELDSYNAILSLVAQGAGWTILTPLALHHAARFIDAVEVLPLENGPNPRIISLSARSGVMSPLVGRVAEVLRGPIRDRIMAPALSRWPWLERRLRLF